MGLFSSNCQFGPLSAIVCAVAVGNGHLTHLSPIGVRKDNERGAESSSSGRGRGALLRFSVCLDDGSEAFGDKLAHAFCTLVGIVREVVEVARPFLEKGRQVN